MFASVKAVQVLSCSKRACMTLTRIEVQIRVYDGKAIVQVAGQKIWLKSGRRLNLNATGKLKARKFDKQANADDFLPVG